MTQSKDDLQAKYNELCRQLGVLQLNKQRNVRIIDKQIAELVDQCMTLEKEAEHMDAIEKATQEAINKLNKPIKTTSVTDDEDFDVIFPGARANEKAQGN
jgi:hypothetical protein